MVLWQLLRWGRVPRRRYPNLVHHRVRRYAPANATPLRRCVYIYCTLLRIRLSCEAKRFASRQTSLWRSGWLTSSTRLQRIAILDTSSLNDAPHQPFRVEPWAMDTQCLLYLLCQVDHGKFSFSSQSQRPQASLYLHTPFNRRQCLPARHGQRPSRDDRRGAL